MTNELKPCKCGAKNSDDSEMLQIQFATQSDNSSLKREGTIFYVRCLKCGYIGPLVLCPNGLSKKKIFAAWNTRHESDELPEWVKKAIDNEMLGHIAARTKYNGIRAVIHDSKIKALEWVLSLRKPEGKE